MTILFWALVSLVIFTYLGYPLVLWIFAKVRPREVHRSKIHPPVSIIIAARNEAEKIRGKINNTLTLDYPPSLLEVIVASDASDDATDEIVRQYTERGVRLVRATHRGGKEYAQGLAVAIAKGEILVFTDTATILEPDALSRLVENFADPTVGAVSTEDVLTDAVGTPTSEGLYVKYEMWVRRLESRFHSLVGLSGSCFAIRRELCTEWSPRLASDFMGTLRAARRGYRSVADPSARGKFPAVVSSQQEIPRKIRTFLRGITVLMANLDMLNPFRYGRFALQLASHKLLRFLAPFLLLAILATTALLMDNHPYRIVFWAQVGFYTLAVTGGFINMLQRNCIIRVAYYFTMAQWTMLVAWGRYVRGHHQVAWEPSKRPEIVTRDRGSTI
jgi:cellulose synthase/poly-beta-1,6-N-acetylglucosamine synthase-like glycosyltransferase